MFKRIRQKAYEQGYAEAAAQYVESNNRILEANGKYRALHLLCANSAGDVHVIVSRARFKSLIQQHGWTYVNRDGIETAEKVTPAGGIVAMTPATARRMNLAETVRTIPVNVA